MKNEFIAFIKNFGVIGLAIGVIVGGAATKIVTSLVENILTPLIGLIPNLDSLSRLNLILENGETFKIAAEAGADDVLVSNFGIFATDLINFIALMLVVFIAVKFAISKIMTKEELEKINI